MQRKGVSPPAAKAIVRSRSTVIAALMVEARRSRRDAVRPGRQVQRASSSTCCDVLGLDPGVKCAVGDVGGDHDRGRRSSSPTRTCSSIRPPSRSPSRRSQAAYRLRLFGIDPKVALISHSNFGSIDNAERAQDARALEIMQRARAQARGRGRDARRRRAERGDPRAHLPELAPERLAPTCWCCPTSTPPTPPTTSCA